MSNSLVLFDRFAGRIDLFPIVATRPIGNLRIGAVTLDQKWSFLFQADVSFLTVDYLSSKFPLSISTASSLVIKASVLPNSMLIQALRNLKMNERLIDMDGEWIGFVTGAKSQEEILKDIISMDFKEVTFKEEYQSLKYVEDIFTYNASQIEFDVSHLNFEQYVPDEHLVSIGGDQCFIAKSANLSKCILNSTSGAIVIQDNAVVEADCVIHGPAVIGKNVRVKTGTVIYPNVSIGDHSTICGELNNVVIWGNSSKGHYGYLGCAVIGQGCNLGAGTTNSNLKNDWNTVKLYNYQAENFRDTGLLKCGVFIGDHSMLAISSKINTGTVIGVGAQIAMSNFIPKFVPDFSWYTDANAESYIFTKFVQMMARKAKVKNESFTKHEQDILQYIYKQTDNLRNN